MEESQKYFHPTKHFLATFIHEFSHNAHYENIIKIMAWKKQMPFGTNYVVEKSLLFGLNFTTEIILKKTCLNICQKQLQKNSR